MPRVPPRRKKSAPAAFHLQALQSSGQLRQGLAGGGSDGPAALQPVGGAPFPRPAFLNAAAAATPEADGPKESKPEAASLLGDHQDPFWSLLRHPNLLNDAWHSKTPDPLDAGPWNLRRAHTAPLHASGSAAQEPPPEHRQSDFGPWVAVGDEDRRTVLQAFDPLAEA